MRLNNSRLISWILLILMTFSITSYAQTIPLPAEQAFQLNKVSINDNQQIVTNWHIHAGYYLYQNRFQFTTNDKHVKLGQPIFPKTTIYKVYPDGTKMLAHTGEFQILIPIQNTTKKTIEFNISYQGCSELGLCYPQQNKVVKLALPETNTTSQSNNLANILQNQPLWMVLIIFFGIGILLSFTPCVLPMIPILSSIIVGHKKINQLQAFGISLAYVLGMALSYAALGLIVGLLGSRVQAILQTPWVITLFATLIVLMALSLFGLFNLQLPLFLRSKISRVAIFQKQGSYLGAAVMGVASTLILSPCITPALATAILYIANKGSVILGTFALLSMGFGMGIPLLIVGGVSQKLLPKAGHWMNGIKTFIGFLLLALAIALMARILPGKVNMILWALFAISVAIALRAFSSTQTIKQHIAKVFGLLCFIYAILLTLGAFSGVTNPLKPLPTTYSSSQNKLPFQRIVSLDEFKRLQADAIKQHKPILLDFYADWCIECHQIDQYTFSNPQVQTLLSSYILIRADISANSPENQALEKHFEVIAPPTLLFFNPKGEEIKTARLVGAVSADQLLTSANKMR